MAAVCRPASPQLKPPSRVHRRDRFVKKSVRFSCNEGGGGGVANGDNKTGAAREHSQRCCALPLPSHLQELPPLHTELHNTLWRASHSRAASTRAQRIPYRAASSQLLRHAVLNLCELADNDDVQHLVPGAHHCAGGEKGGTHAKIKSPLFPRVHPAPATHGLCPWAAASAPPETWAGSRGGTARPAWLRGGKGWGQFSNSDTGATVGGAHTRTRAGPPTLNLHVLCHEAVALGDGEIGRGHGCAPLKNEPPKAFPVGMNWVRTISKRAQALEGFKFSVYIIGALA